MPRSQEANLEEREESTDELTEVAHCSLPFQMDPTLSFLHIKLQAYQCYQKYSTHWLQIRVYILHAVIANVMAVETPMSKLQKSPDPKFIRKHSIALKRQGQAKITITACLES